MHMEPENMVVGTHKRRGLKVRFLHKADLYDDEKRY